MKMGKDKKLGILLLAVLVVGAISVPNVQAVDLSTKVSGFLSSSDSLLSFLFGVITGYVAPGGGGGSGFALTVYKSGTGSGTVTGLGINCGSDCYQDYGDFTSVQLTAAPASGHTFTGWSGCNSVDINNKCTVTLGGTNKAVTASFSAPVTSYSLTVTANPFNSGTITGSGISCSTQCSKSYASGTTVTLSAGANSGYTFTGWVGCPSPSGNQCTATITADKSITATFQTTSTYSLTAEKRVGGTLTAASGTISGALSCGTTCSSTSGSFASASTQTLTATSAQGYSFSSWTGCTSVSGTQCSVAMTAAKTVTANFNPVSYYTLTTAKSGTGSGTITSVSPPIGISCGSDCTEQYTQSTYVTVRAAANTGSTFNGWTGCDSVSGTDCSVTMNTGKTVTAAFTLNSYPLTVTLSGNGTGVISDPSFSYIGCPTDCSETLPYGTPVTLQVFSLAPNSVFGGWGGICASAGANPTCTFNIGTSNSVSASFVIPSYLLTAAKSGTGSGTISGAGFNCGTDCTEGIAKGSTVTLTATPDTNNNFAGWSGCDSVSGTQCTVTVHSNRQVAAAFSPPNKYQLTISQVGTGSGSVSRDIAGTNCGQNCFEYTQNTLVTLTPNANFGSAFSGWTGCGSVSTNNQCKVTMDASKTVTANFTLNTYQLSVSKTGQGTVTSINPTGINCGTDCTLTVNHGTTVNLSASPANGWTFGPWQGCQLVEMNGGPCTVTMDSDKSVSATFYAIPPNVSATHWPASPQAGQQVIITATATAAGSATISSDNVKIFVDGVEKTAPCRLPDVPEAGPTGLAAPTGPGVGPVPVEGSSVICEFITSSLSSGTHFYYATATDSNGASGRDPASGVKSLSIERLENYQLKINNVGNGSGSVSRSQVEVQGCGTNCFEYVGDTSVTLTANHASDSTFVGWSNACTGTTDCTITMSGAQKIKQATANFTLKPVIQPCPGPIKVTITPATVKPGAPFQIIVSGLCEGKFAKKMPVVKID